MSTSGASSAVTAAETSRGQVLLGISVSTTILAMASTGVRFFVRDRVSRGIWWDDYSVVVAMVMGTVGMIFTILEASSLDDRMRAMQFDYLAQPWMMFGSTLSKISVCFFFLRTIGRRRPWNLLLGLMIVVLALLNLAFALMSNLQCRPLEKLWNPAVRGECLDRAVELNFGYFQGGFAVFGFFFLGIFPVLMIRDMNLVRSIRWPFYVLSGSFFIAAVFTVLRSYETSLVGARGTFNADVLLATIFGVLVQNLGIIAANVLPLGPLSSPKAQDLSRLVGDEGNELVERQVSNRSSFISIKHSSTLIIEGPRKMDDTDVEANKGIVNVNLGGDNFGDAFDADTLSKGILRTISVQVTEEDIADSDMTMTGNDIGWRAILNGRPT